MGVNSLPKTLTRQRRGCDLNPGPSAPESSTLTTRLPSHPVAPLRAIPQIFPSQKDRYTKHKMWRIVCVVACSASLCVCQSVGCDRELSESG